MRKPDHDIDNLFKTHFDDFEVPVDNKEVLWQRISPDKSNRRFMIFMFIGLMSVVGMLVAWTIDEIDYNHNGVGGGSVELSIQNLINEEVDSYKEISTEELVEQIDQILEKPGEIEKEEPSNLSLIHI